MGGGGWGGGGLFIDILTRFVFHRSTGLEGTETHDAKASFIGDILKLFSPVQDESSLTVFDKLCKRYYF